MKSVRQQSIEKLKNAVKNKTLTCYQTTDFNIEPLYYDHNFNTCCAVGELFPKEELKKYALGNGDVINLYGIKNVTFIKDILNKADKDELFGLTINELEKIQTLHDECMEGEYLGTRKNIENKLSEFETYINSLN
jgi:hypothetical protein